jgi:microcin C transport system substrate-binding protein
LVAFPLRPQARFHDGSPITVEDVIWTFEALKTKGLPFYRSYYAQVTKAEKVGERKVRFAFGPGDNRELPLILGQLPVLSRAYWSQRDFEKTTLEPPLGNGAYRVEAVDPGRSITYRRVKDYWGARLPVNVGRENFDSIRYDYYKDSTVAVEALKAGEYDFRPENVARIWATAYNTPAVTQGAIRKEEIPNEVPTGMQAFVFNTRRPFFQDPRVRRALAYAFDFEWSNKNLFFGAYTRTKSYFSNSELASSGLPTAEELKVLEPFRGKVPDEVFTREYQPPATDGSGNIRDGAREALKLLAEAGWTVKSQKLVNDRGEPMQFEILLNDPTWERIALPFAKNLERLGIGARVRTVDAAQAEKREKDFDFDMTVDVWRQSLSPGNEPREPEHGGHQGPGRGPAHRPGHRRPGPASPGGPDPRPRPGAAVGPLHHPPLAHPGLSRRLLGQVRAAGRLAEIRARVRHVVGGHAEGGRSRPAQGRDPQVARLDRCWPTSSAACCSSSPRCSASWSSTSSWSRPRPGGPSTR